MRKGRPGVLVFLVAMFAVILYWPSLGLPVIYDSLLHIRIAKGLNLITVWLPTEKFGFYRPLTFLPLIIIREIWNAYPAWLLHGLNVFQHALNAVLLMALSWKLWRRRSWALTSGLLLATFPFAYQAIAVYGHNVHPTTSGLLLLGLLTYLRALERHRAGWWWLTALFFVLGLLSHESAILFGPLAALVQWNYRREGQSSSQVDKRTDNQLFSGLRPIWPWLLFTTLGIIYLGIYQLLPLSRNPQEVGTTLLSHPKVLYLMQAAAYPITWFAHLLPDTSALHLVLSGLAVALLLTFLSARSREHRLPLLLGWGWWGVASLVIALPLPTDYLLHGPRLLYLSGIGLALLWPVILEPIFVPFRSRQQARNESLKRWANFSFRLLVVGFIVLAGWRFVRDELSLYRQMTAPINLVKDVMNELPEDRGILIVNLPGWVAPTRNTYALGSEHVAVMGYHLFVEELFAVNLNVKRSVRAISLPELLQKTDYAYQVVREPEDDSSSPVEGSSGGTEVFLVDYTEEGIQSRHTGWIETSPPAIKVAQFGSYQLVSAQAVDCGGSVEVATVWHWNDDAIPGPSTSLFVQLLSRDGQMVAQADGPLLGIRPDLFRYEDEFTFTDRRILDAGDGAPYELMLGVYDYASGERFEALDSLGNQLPDQALRIPVEICFPVH